MVDGRRDEGEKTEDWDSGNWLAQAAGSLTLSCDHGQQKGSPARPQKEEQDNAIVRLGMFDGNRRISDSSRKTEENGMTMISPPDVKKG